MNRITKLKPQQVFVFGSNYRGIHVKGAALDAHSLFGAVTGVAAGPTGQSYAIPTKDHHLRPLPLEIIARQVEAFLDYARMTPARRHGKLYLKSPGFASTAPMCPSCGHTICKHGYGN